MNPVSMLDGRGEGRSIFDGAPATRENFDRALTGSKPVAVGADEQFDDAPVQTEDQATEADQEQPNSAEADDDVSTMQQAPAAAFDLESVRAELEADIGKKATKTLMDKVIRPLTEQVSGVATQTAHVRVDRLVQKFGGVFPELKRPAALQAAIAVAQTRQQKTGESDEKAMGWSLAQIYGDRKAEMRAQVAGQITSPTRMTTDGRKPVTNLDASRAAFMEYERLGGGQAGLQGAMALKKRLTN